MKIRVTRKHIENGEREMTAYCPVALAMVSAGFKGVGVHNDHVEVITKGGRYPTVEYYELPKKVQRFVLDYDMERPVKPFTFSLPVEGK